uniref:Oxysterol-binding protein-related protein 2 n=1 Tax=Aceria tosichella TaxID=561515 RepID=A0A6G1SNA5_9ACAR
MSNHLKTPHTSRTRLPAPMVPRDQVSIWSILKNCIGKELSKITMPVVFNEPVTMLQRAVEGIEHTRILKMADLSDNPVERMELICAFVIASISCNCHRIVKPFNPLLYETFEYDHELEDGSHVKAIAQQVSHHPPITAASCESDNFVYNGVINPKIKFWGRSIEITHDGALRIHLKSHNETYLFNAVPCSIHNIIVGKLWFEHHGPLVINCYESNIQANITFKQAGWFSNEVHRFDGFIVSGTGASKTNSEKKKLKFVYGKWSDYIKSVDYSDYEKFMNGSQQKQFKIPDAPDYGQVNGLTAGMSNLGLSGSPNSVNNNSITSGPNHSKDSKASQRGGDKKSGVTKSESTLSLDIPNSKTLWRLESQYFSEYYNFTLFTMKLNELTSELEKTLPRTDSRFRPDVRKLEEGDLDGAASEKQRLEDKQREARARDKRFREPSADFLFFEQSNVPNSKEKLWLYKGGYWENRCNPSRFPDLF